MVLCFLLHVDERSVQYIATLNPKKENNDLDKRLLRHLSHFWVENVLHKLSAVYFELSFPLQLDVPGTESSCTIFRALLRFDWNSTGFNAILQAETFCNKSVMVSIRISTR